jgi:putative RecB family exonuclease
MPARKASTPRKPRFSPTRLALYQFCPKAYHYYYVRGLRWSPLTAGHSFGGSLHRTLQSFHGEGAESSVDALLETYRATWSAAGYASSAEEAAHFAAGEELLRRYHTGAREPGRETIAVETTLRVDYPEFALFGKIDRLDRLETGELQVIDYKSGRATVTEEQVRGSLALAVYQLLVARRHPGVPVSAAILCLRSGDMAAVRRSDNELELLEQDLRERATAILADTDYHATPGPHCAGCAFFRICPAADRSASGEV